MEKKNKKRIILIGHICFFILCVTGVALLFIRTRQCGEERNGIYWIQTPEEAFLYPSICAQSTRIDTNTIDVLELNTGEYRYLYRVNIKDTKFLWRHELIQKEDLKEGDIVFIQYGGSVKESYPAKIKAELVYYLGDKENFFKTGEAGGEE